MPKKIRLTLNPGALSQKIKDLRKQAGMTQKDMEAASGILQPSLSELERGTRLPSLETIRRVFEALGYEVELEAFIEDR